MRTRARMALVVTLAAVTTAALTGCGADDWDRRTMPEASGTVAPDFWDEASPPIPEGTFTPHPDTWKGIRPPEGFRVALLTTGDDKPTTTLVKAVRDWADSADVDLKTVRPTTNAEIGKGIDEAIALNADLVVAVGHDLIDPLALATANHLQQKFLVVGAELAEPTGNVTSADWAGASFRGEGLGMSSTYDPESFTPERARRAIRAGVATVLSGHSGYVVWLD